MVFWCIRGEDDFCVHRGITELEVAMSGLERDVPVFVVEMLIFAG